MPDMECAQNTDEVDEPWLRKLRWAADLLRYGCIVEIAAENKSVAEYVRHWEGRAIGAEEKIERLEKELKFWQALDEHLPPGYAVGDDATAELAVKLVEAEQRALDAERERDEAHRILDGYFADNFPDSSCATCRDHSVGYRAARALELQELRGKVGS